MRNQENRGGYSKGGRGGGKRLSRQEWERDESWDEPDSPAYLELKAQLTAYYQRGVRVSLNGVRMPVSRIARICAVREEGNYMGDFIVDETGRLKEVRFDRVGRD